MKRHALIARPCPCGGMIVPTEFEHPSNFKHRKYCSVTCPALNETKRNGSRQAAAKLRREAEEQAAMKRRNDPVSRYLRGGL